MELEGNKSQQTSQESSTATVGKVSFALGLSSIIIPFFAYLLSLLLPHISNMWAYMILSSIIGFGFIFSIFLAIGSIISGILGIDRKKKLKGNGWAISGYLMGLLPMLYAAILVLFEFFKEDFSSLWEKAYNFYTKIFG